MKAIGIIPARFASTRFPGKPLTLIHGKTMVERVYVRAKKSASLATVVVATDDVRIYDHVMAFGGVAVMTSPEHPSGTDRCAETLQVLKEAYDLIINIQGDEPYIHPEQIDQLVKCFTDANAEIGTLVKVISEEAEVHNVNIPKVVRDKNGWALYFSRHAIPYCKSEEITAAVQNKRFLKHIGIYGYRSHILPVLAALPPGKLEKSESLEQLRWLENGFKIMTAETQYENVAVDVPADVQIIEKRFNGSD